MKFRIRVFFFLLALFFMMPIHHVSASALVPVSVSFSLEETPSIGALVSYDQNGYRLTNIRYDSQLVGVVVDTSDLIMKYEDDQRAGVYTDRYIADGGEAQVRVNSANGLIQKGDYITASDTRGEGMRADQDGIVLGIALEDMDQGNRGETSLITALIDPRFTTLDASFTVYNKYGIFGDIVEAILDVSHVTPEKLSHIPPIFRYILSALILIAVIVFGFVYFGRIAIRGIESLGRNPLARRTILSGVILNIIFVTFLIGFALLLAYIILII